MAVLNLPCSFLLHSYLCTCQLMSEAVNTVMFLGQGLEFHVMETLGRQLISVFWHQDLLAVFLTVQPGAGKVE